MAQDPESWIKNAFQWTPEIPFRNEPEITGSLHADESFSEPRIENSARREPMVTPAPQSQAEEAARVPVQPRGKRRAESLFLPRLVVGFAQGVFLAALLAARDVLNPYFYSAALMVLLFAPLLLLAGMGRMRDEALLWWAGSAALALAALGAYHHWRTASADGGHPGLVLLALTSLFLFIAQAIAQAWTQDYAAHYRSAWQLAVRIAVCALFAALAWAVRDAASGFLRIQDAQLSTLALPLVTLSVALAAHCTGDRLMGALQGAALFVFTMALPFLLVAALGICGLNLVGWWQPSAMVTLVTAGLLIVAINASYRDGASWRGVWRRRVEFAGALMLTPLAILAAFALSTRLQQFGWTDGRALMMALTLMLGGYAVCYAGSALISLGGGGWMQRIEDSNLSMAFAALTLIAALLSPIADPARLAVASQTWRLEQNKVRAELFDFLWLRDGGQRFGHDALEDMAADRNAPASARGAFAALSAPPEAVRPTPTEIGANIHVHALMGLPTGLLARDWSNVADAPPCLSRAAIPCDAFFADLDGDGQSEVILAYGTAQHWWAGVMKQGQGNGNQAGGWYVAGTLAAPPCPGSLEALRAGQFSVARPGGWRDLLVNGMRLRVDRPAMPSACP
jgi:hypothetical protein